MRIPTRALLGIAGVLAVSVASAQPQPQPRPPGPPPGTPQPPVGPLPLPMQPLPGQPVPGQPGSPDAQPTPGQPGQVQPQPGRVDPGEEPSDEPPPDGAPSAPARTEAPPAPPLPGGRSDAPEPPPAMAPLWSEEGGTVNAAALVGFHDGFFLRDAHDRFRLYPQGELDVDFHAFAGRDVYELKAAGGGNALAPRLFLRRVRLELAGEFLERIAFTLGVDFGGQRLVNASGSTQQSAAPAGEDPSAASARFATVQAAATSPAIDDAWVDVNIAPQLHVMLGQQRTPLTMDNRTPEGATTFPERNLAIRGFVVPDVRETGVTAWGELASRRLAYEVGAYGGDGANRPQVDNRADVIGRIFVRPLFGDRGKGALARLQIGASARHGDRDPDYVGYSYAPLVTGQGFVLWQPSYSDTSGRRVHVLPSGPQNAVGGELRLPISRFELRAEAYWVANDTREAIDGYQLTNTERLGRITGLGAYVQLSAWPWGDAFVNGDPGLTRPRHLDTSRPVPRRRGLELAALLALVAADYDGASRQGAYDPNTPGAPNTPTDITALQYGGAATYWYTRHLRATLTYSAYHLPNRPNNQARLPTQAIDPPTDGPPLLHELGTRLGLSF